MHCDEALNLLNARADGQLAANQADLVDSHLAECAACRAAAEGLATINADLRQAFAPRRAAAAKVAERAAASLPRSPSDIAPVATTPVPAPRFRWGQMLLAMAAGFLLAVALFRPWERRVVEIAPPGTAPPVARPVAELTLASAPVDVWPGGGLAVFKCPAQTPLASDSIVRTGPTERCEISLGSGCAVRLDCNTEVKLGEGKVVEVHRGRLWSCSQPGSKGIEIQSAGSKIVAQPPSELAVDCQPDAMRLIVVEGAASVRAGQASQEIGPGKQARIVAGKLEVLPQLDDVLLETAWVNRVLALAGAEHPELQERVQQLLAKVGAVKLSLLYEDELRRLGDAGVAPLLAYLQTTRDMPQFAQRATAARIIADVAESRWIADLIALLTDANADVRFHAARALERLTGRDQGHPPAAWQSAATWLTCEGPYEKWLAWWDVNRDRYPSARREIPAPASPPF